MMPAGKYTVQTAVVEVEESGKAMKVELFQRLGKAELSSRGKKWGVGSLRMVEIWTRRRWPVREARPVVELLGTFTEHNAPNCCTACSLHPALIPSLC